MSKDESIFAGEIQRVKLDFVNLVTETKTDFSKTVASYQDVIVSQIRTLGNTMIAECNILSGRIGGHKEALDRAIGVIQTELGAFQLATERRISILETKQEKAIRSASALPAVEEKNGSVTMAVLRDVALLIAMIGTLYAILRDSFVTPRDLMMKNPPPPMVDHGKP